MNFDKVLFWPALDDVLDQGGWDINPFGGQVQTLVVAARPADDARSAHAFYRDAFRFEVVRAEGRRDYRAPEANGLRVTVRVSWEPRLLPISLRQPLSQLQAVDENGLNLLPLDRSSVLNASIESGISSVEIGIPLQLPSPPRPADRSPGRPP